MIGGSVVVQQVCKYLTLGNAQGEVFLGSAQCTTAWCLVVSGMVRLSRNTAPTAEAVGG